MVACGTGHSVTEGHRPCLLVADAALVVSCSLLISGSIGVPVPNGHFADWLEKGWSSCGLGLHLVQWVLTTSGYLAVWSKDVIFLQSSASYYIL
jgi:hypothetical protein